MAQTQLESRLQRRREGYQLTYTLPQHLFASQVYPRPSPNGSTVIITAHEQGLTALWYGGKRFKNARRHAATNGDSLDLTDDIVENTIEFEAEYDELDPGIPSRDLVQRLEIPLGTGANKIALLPSPVESRVAVQLSIFETHILIGVTCLDQSLRIVAIPLTPQLNPARDVQVVRLATASAHQDLISDIAITMTADGIEEDEVNKRMRSRSRGRVREEETDSFRSQQKWSLLVASVSPTGVGLLLVHHIPVTSEGISTDPEEHVPIYRRFLRSPVASCRIAFNPSPFPAERHSHLLVAIPDSSMVQVYDTMPYPDSTKRRRGSLTTIESTSSSNRAARQPSASGVRPLITLLPGYFRHAQSDFAIPRRKRVLDAKWIMQGRAIIVLLEDGEWGIWDLEAVGPTPSTRSNNLVKGQSNTSGIHGGSLARLAARGAVATSTVVASKPSITGKSSTASTLAPMTPHTRQERSTGLFQSKDTTEGFSHTGCRSKGSITLSSYHLTSSSTSKSQDESVILSYGMTNVLIPSIQAFWRSEAGAKAAFDAVGSGRSTTLPVINTNAEGQISAHLLSGIAVASGWDPIRPAFLVSTASRLILLIPPPAYGSSSNQATASLPMRLTSAKSEGHDQALLESGELDIDGMDRILGSMAHSSADQSMLVDKTEINQSRLGASHTINDGDDEDVDMDTPTAARSAQAKLTITNDRSARRRLFA